MVEKIRNNKKNFTWVFVAVLLFTAIIFSGQVFSVAEHDRFIQFKNYQVLNLGEKSNDVQWFDNQSTISFYINLEDDFQEGLQKRPFQVSAEYDGKSIPNGKITYKEEVNGVFRVSIDTGGSEVGELKVFVNINEGNEWDIDTKYSTQFNIIKDQRLPNVMIKGVADGAFISDKEEYPTIKIDVIEDYSTSNKVTVTRNGNSYEGDFPTEWVKDGTTYSLAHQFTINGEYKLVVEAKDAAGNVTSASIEFTISKKVPTLSVEGFENNGYFKPNKNVAISVDSDIYIEASAVTIKPPNGDPIEKNLVVSQTKTRATETHDFDQDGKYELIVVVSDKHKNGRKQYTLEPVSFTIDGDEPVIQLDLKNDKVVDDNYYKSDVPLEVTITDQHLAENTIVVTKDGGAYRVPNFEVNGDEARLNYTFSETGQYTVTVTAKDKAQNSASKEVSFTINKNGPEIDVELPDDEAVNQSFYNTAVPLKVNVIDRMLNENSIKVTKDGKEYKLPNDLFTIIGNLATLNYTFNNEGRYEITVTAKDSANIVSTKKVHFTIDKTKPVIDVEINNKGVGNQKFHKKAVPVEVTITDENFDLNTISVKKNGSEYSLANTDFHINGKVATLNYTFKDDGSYEIVVSAIDKAGNRAVDHIIDFVIDSGFEKLDIDIENPNVENGHYYQADVPIAVSIKDNHLSSQTISVTKNGEVYENVSDDDFVKNGAWTTLNYTFSDPGNYEVTVTATDKANNSKTKTVNFTIDKQDPLVEIELKNNQVKNGFFYKAEVPVEIIVTDENLDKNLVSVKRNGQNYPLKDTDFSIEAGKAVMNYSFKDEGNYEITVTGIDKAGRSKTSELVHFTIDQTKPLIKIENKNKIARNETYYQADVPVKVTVTDVNLDVNTITVTKNGVQFPLSGTNFVIDGHEAVLTYTFSEEGDYKVKVTATDKAGNDAIEQALDFTIDKEKPEVELNIENPDVKGGHFYQQDVPISASIKDLNLDLNTVVVKRNGAVYGNSDLKFIEDGTIATLHYTFNLEGNYEVTVTGVDKAGNEQKQSVHFTIDKTNPDIKIDVQNPNVKNGKHYKANIPVEVTVTDENLNIQTISVTRDGNSYQLADADFILQGNKAVLNYSFTKEGDYEVTVTATDKAERGPISKVVNFTLDKQAPTIDIQVSDLDKGPYYNKDITPVKVAVTNRDLNLDVNKIEVKRNGVTYENSGLKFIQGDDKSVATLSYGFTEEGDYLVLVTAIDKAGNSKEQSIEFTIDKTLPKIEFDLKNKDVSNSKYYKADLPVEVTITDTNLEKNTIKVTRNGNAYADVKSGDFVVSGRNAKLNYTFTREGDYVITVEATDKARNQSLRTIEFTIDKTTPTLAISGVENSEHYNKNRDLKVIVNDTNIDVSKTEITVTRKETPTAPARAYQVGPFSLSNNNTRASLNYRFTEEGIYTINLRSTDKAGNRQVHDEITFVIDKTKPILKIDGVEHNSFNPTDKRVTLSIDELHHLTNTVQLTTTRDGAAYNMGTWSNTAKVSNLSHHFTQEGLYTITFIATDKAGNGPVTETKTFTIDKTNPVIEITGVENNEYYNVDKPVRVQIKDVNLDVNKMIVTKDGVNYPVGNFTVNNNVASLSHNFSQEGRYEIFVEAIDKAENRTEQRMMFTIDKTAPVITPKFRGEDRVIVDGEYINRIFTPQFVLDETEDTIVSVILNGGSNMGNSVPMASTDMVYNYSVVAVDKAGNETKLQISFTLDTTMPVLDISGIIEGYFNEDKTPTITYSDLNLDPSRTKVTLNGQTFESGTKLDQEKDYILEAIITDLADNVTKRTIHFTIDKTAPTIKFVEPINQMYFNSSLIPNFLIESLSPYEIIALTLNGSPYNLGDPIEQEGKHVLFFEVKDRAGNIKQLSVEFMIDLTPPRVVYEGVVNGQTYYEPLDITIRLDNPLDTISSVIIKTINGDLITGEIVEVNGSQTITTTLSEINNYEIVIEAFDEAGNETTYVLNFEIANKGMLIKYYENKSLFGGSIVFLLSSVAAGTVYLRRRRLKVNEDGPREIIEKID
ncbi:MAG: Ig-like domain-containing protein [Anaerobacillus sp.]|uniref:Ig-like domain-containing protein n=1 Tax=Anaerobacillus sp. TaxID=1872506 RepID=UPI003918FBFE